MLKLIIFNGFSSVEQKETSSSFVLSENLSIPKFPVTIQNLI